MDSTEKIKEIEKLNLLLAFGCPHYFRTIVRSWEQYARCEMRNARYTAINICFIQKCIAFLFPLCLARVKKKKKTFFNEISWTTAKNIQLQSEQITIVSDCRKAQRKQKKGKKMPLLPLTAAWFLTPCAKNGYCKFTQKKKILYNEVVIHILNENEKKKKYEKLKDRNVYLFDWMTIAYSMSLVNSTHSTFCFTISTRIRCVLIPLLPPFSYVICIFVPTDWFVHYELIWICADTSCSD